MTGEQLKLAGMAEAAAHADKTVPDWSALAEAVMDRASIEMNSFTTEEVRTLYGDLLPEPPDKRAWGAVATKLARARKIERVGFVKAKSRTVHGMYVSLWKRVQD